YAWQSIDIYGKVNSQSTSSNSNMPFKGYNGHASIVLPNEHIFIFGGTQDVFFPVYIKGNVGKEEPIFTHRCKILDIFDTYHWEAPLSGGCEKLSIATKVQHISYIIPSEGRNGPKLLFIHGGDSDGKMLCHYNLFNLNEGTFM